MRILLSYNFLIFIAVIVKFLWLKIDKAIPFDFKTEEGKKNIYHFLLGFGIAIFLFFFVPAMFSFDDNPTTDFERLGIAIIYLSIGAFPELILLKIFKIGKARIEQTEESFKIVGKDNTIEQSKVTTTTITPTDLETKQ